MDKEEIKAAATKVDEWAEEKANKHNFTKTQVFVGVAVAVLAVYGTASLLGWF